MACDCYVHASITVLVFKHPTQHVVRVVAHQSANTSAAIVQLIGDSVQRAYGNRKSSI